MNIPTPVWAGILSGVVVIGGAMMIQLRVLASAAFLVCVLLSTPVGGPALETLHQIRVQVYG